MNEIIIVWFVCEFIAAVKAGYDWYCGRTILERDRLYLAPVVIAAGMGLLQAGIGAAQKMKAAKMAASNKRPQLTNNPYTQEAYDLTGARAGEGLSAGSMQAYTTNTDRSLASSLDAIMKSGGSANNIADLYDNSSSEIRALALANDQRRMENVASYLQNGIKPMADQERDQWFIDQEVPYKDNSALISSLSSSGMDNMFKGLNTTGSAVINKLYEDSYNKDLKANYGSASSVYNATPRGTGNLQLASGPAPSIDPSRALPRALQNSPAYSPPDINWFLKR